MNQTLKNRLEELRLQTEEIISDMKRSNSADEQMGNEPSHDPNRVQVAEEACSACFFNLIDAL